MGLGAARQLAQKGANICIVARDVEKLKESISHVSVWLQLCRPPHSPQSDLGARTEHATPKRSVSTTSAVSNTSSILPC